MKDLLKLILENITTHPEEIDILESQDEGRTVYTISVHPEDMGRVIGKSGKVIKAIRSLAHVIAIRKNERFRINVAEVDGGIPQTDTVEAEDTTEEIIEEQPAPSKKSAPAPKETDNDDAGDLISGAIDLSEEAEE